MEHLVSVKKTVRIAESAADLRRFLDKTIFKSDFSLQRIKLAEQNQWSIKSGALSHISNGFFHVAGIRSRISGAEHLILFQPQSALTGLALFRDGSQIYLLLQARVEPGLPNIGEYGPTIQSTAANYLRMHGGKSTSYVELFRSFSPIANALGSNIQFDLGKRYFFKSKLHSYLELDEQVETKENMIWVPLQVVGDVLANDNFLNPDLRSLLSVFDWDLFVNNELSGSSNTEVAEDDDFAFPASKLGSNEWKLIGLDQLTGWEVQEYGVAAVSDAGIWVDMVHVSCFSREVREWSQPLLSCSSQGLVVLLVRRVNDQYEFLLSMESEFGISGGRTVLPSYVIYPGADAENIGRTFENDTLLAEMTQSEEGGRFFQNESLYRVFMVAGDNDIEPQQRWVSAEILKSILKSSNRASLQLRCIVSLILDLLNPNSFM